VEVVCEKVPFATTYEAELVGITVVSVDGKFVFVTVCKVNKADVTNETFILDTDGEAACSNGVVPVPVSNSAQMFHRKHKCANYVTM